MMDGDELESSESAQLLKIFGYPRFESMPSASQVLQQAGYQPQAPADYRIELAGKKHFCRCIARGGALPRVRCRLALPEL